MSLQGCTCKISATTPGYFVFDRTGCEHHSDEAVAELAAAREAARLRARYAVGTAVHVHYDYSEDITAVVCETPEFDLRCGWVMVEQTSGYEGEAERPRFLALESMISPVADHE